MLAVMTTSTVSAAKLLREGVAEEVRVLLARKRMSGSALAQAIGQSQSYVSRRLNGSTAFDLDDLQNIAAVLEVPVAALLPSMAAGVPDRESVTVDSLKTADKGMRHTNRPIDTRPSGRPRSGGIRRPRLIGDLFGRIGAQIVAPSLTVA